MRGKNSGAVFISWCPSRNEILQQWAVPQASKSEMSNFLQDQGNQGIARPAGGREQTIPQIYPPLADSSSLSRRSLWRTRKIAEKGHF
jgi:hypothetical protein